MDTRSVVAIWLNAQARIIDVQFSTRAESTSEIVKQLLRNFEFHFGKWTFQFGKKHFFSQQMDKHCSPCQAFWWPRQQDSMPMIMQGRTSLSFIARLGFTNLQLLQATLSFFVSEIPRLGRLFWASFSVPLQSLLAVVFLLHAADGAMLPGIFKARNLRIRRVDEEELCRKRRTKALEEGLEASPASCQHLENHLAFRVKEHLDLSKDCIFGKRVLSVFIHFYVALLPPHSMSFQLRRTSFIQTGDPGKHHFCGSTLS